MYNVAILAQYDPTHVYHQTIGFTRTRMPQQSWFNKTLSFIYFKNLTSKSLI